MLSVIKKEKNKKRLQKRLLMIVSFLFIIGIAIVCSYNIYNYYTYTTEENKIEEFFYESNDKAETNEDIVKEEEKPIQEKQEVEMDKYIGVLEIPVINLKKGFLETHHKNNIVDKNIQIIENSDMPNVINGLMVIAGHSGNGKVAFFKNLYKLKLNDEVFIYYNGIKYIYKIVDIYNEEKDGTISVNKKQATTLVLTTCSQTDKTKQIVIIAEQIEQKSY